MTSDPEEEDRPDLRPLDPRADAAGFGRVVRGIVDAAGPELARRRLRYGRGVYGLWSEIRAWRRPVLALSGAVALASVLVLLLVKPSGSSGFAEAAGVPSAWAEWLQAGQNPAPADLIGLDGSAQ